MARDRSLIGKWIGFLLAAFVLVSLPAASRGASPGGGDEGTDVMPAFAAIAVEGPLDAITVDGSSWTLVSDEAIVEAAAASGVTAIVQVGLASMLEVGQLSERAELAALASLAAAQPRRVASAPDVDTHPAPPHDEYNLKKKIHTPKGDKDVYKTLVVEKRAGETGDEFQKRSEAELRDALAAGWESVP